jgi:sugar-specific transcriptional regulator TrmB
MDIPIELKELGLDDNEIRIYLACLKQQGLNVKQIAEQTGLIRTTVYGVIKSLMQKGLISKIDKANIMIFHSTSPKELLNILEQKRINIESIIPKLEKYQNIILPTYRMEMFEGMAGIKALTNDIISKANEIVMVIGAGQKWIEFSSIFSSIYYRKKKEMNVHTKTLLADTKEEKTFFKGKKHINSEIKFIKDIDFEATAIYIYQDKVSFVVYDQDIPRGFMIQDKTYNKIQKEIFNKLWNKAKK